MSAAAKYHLKTVLFGLLAVPVLVSLGMLVVFAITDSDLWRTVAGVVMVLVTQVPLWARHGRRADRPERWLPALVPVVAPPAYFLLVWVVAYGVTGGFETAVNVLAIAGFPYLVLILAVLFGTSASIIPIILAAVLLASLSGFVIGCRRAPRPAGRHALVAITVASVVLAGIAGGQVWHQAATAALLSGDPSMPDEVDLLDYTPWRPGNRLAVPDRPASLTMAGPIPRLDGATALYPVYGAIAQATYPHPDNLTEDQAYEFVDTYVPCSTTSAAYDRLIAGEADAIFVAQPSSGQLAKADAAGVDLKLTPIGREAFVFFVNRSSPIENLTLDQVRDIYSKRVTNWKQVGGPDEPIIAFQRPEDSGSQTAMLAMVMKDREPAPPLKEELASGMGGIVSEVAQYRNLSGAIGYSFRWYATVMNANPDIKLIAIDGVAPSVENIRNGSYPLTGALNVVTAGSTNPNLDRLIDWIMSAEGQSLVEKTGYVGR